MLVRIQVREDPNVKHICSTCFFRNVICSHACCCVLLFSTHMRLGQENQQLKLGLASTIPCLSKITTTIINNKEKRRILKSHHTKKYKYNLNVKSFIIVLRWAYFVTLASLELDMQNRLVWKFYQLSCFCLCSAGITVVCRRIWCRILFLH